MGIYWNKDASKTEPKETNRRPARPKRPVGRIQPIPGGRTWVSAADEDDPVDPDRGEGRK